MKRRRDLHQSVLLALSSSREDGKLELRSPAVGLWREQPSNGSLLQPNARIGQLEVLGQLRPMYAPAAARGLVVETGGDQAAARRPVHFQQMLVLLDPAASSETDSATSAAATIGNDSATTTTGLVFRASTSGRFYERPGPDKEPFVKVGDVVEQGHAVAILEVMKTFNRLFYGGNDLPARARVLRIVPADGADLNAGDPILELEAAPA